MQEEYAKKINNANINDVSINAVFSNSENSGFSLSWDSKELGFGEISFIQFHKNGKIRIDSEHMGKDFVKKVLHAFVDIAKLEVED